MRQAGRYLPEYNATRRRAGSFLRLCRDPALATEVTLQPLARFPLDAAIIFSDILTVPDAMGLGLAFVEGDGPRFERPLADETAIGELAVPDLARLAYVFDAVAAAKRALAGSVPLLGFAGSPFTLACYMIDGQGGSDFPRTRRLLYGRPDLLHRVLAINADAVAAYLAEQARHGADALMLFDTWGGLLSSDAYARFSLAYMVNAIEQVRTRGTSVPIIVFTRGGGQWLERIANCGCDAIGLDWTTDVSAARSRVGNRVALQGNLDPQALLAPAKVIEAEAAAILRAAGSAPGFVFNLGHGVIPETPPQHVATLVDYVHSHSRKKFGAEGKSSETRAQTGSAGA
jgi:uroporphyrinogen decarboxylase